MQSNEALQWVEEELNLNYTYIIQTELLGLRSQLQSNIGRGRNGNACRHRSEG